MRSGIYEITFTGNNRRYIGSAHNPKRRMLEHLSMLRRSAHPNIIMQRCFDIYGESSFNFRMVETCDKSTLIEREQFHIDGMTKSQRMNVCLVAGNTAGRKHSEKTKDLIRKKALGRTHPPRTQEYRDAVSRRFKNKQISPEHMAALQKGRSERVYTDEQRLEISEKLKEGYKNGKRSRVKKEDHKNKIGKSFAKLTDDEVREIRKLKSEGHTCKSLALKFNSNVGTISQISNRIRYRWVD